MAMRPRILLVGAGATGQVFGWFLHAAGCEPSFLVKEKYAEETRRGFTLYELGLFEPEPTPLQFSGFGVLTSPEQAAAQRWDQVWLCISSTALRAGGSVEALARVTGDASWVMLQPAIEDRDWLCQHIPPERLVSGMIPFLSFHAPLRPEEPVPTPGTAFWFPPLSRGPFSGPEARLREVLQTLRRGGYPARRHEDVTREMAIPSAIITAVITGLERAGWSFERFLEPRALEQVLRATREAVRIAAWRTKTSASSVLPLLRPTLFRMLMPTASWAAPFDLETYLRVHFTKVADQTRWMLREYLTLGTQAGLPVEELRALSSP